MRFLLSFLIVALFALNAYAEANFNKVLIIVLGNTDYNSALKQPFLSQLAKEGALLSNYKAVSYVSQPNYLALIGGSTFNVKTDLTVDLLNRHIGDLLEEKNRTWKLYAEGFPDNCFQGKKKGNYVRHHAPFISFKNVSASGRCKNIVEGHQFFIDLPIGALPDYSLFIPNIQNSGHDTSITYADNWLRDHFDELMHSSIFPKDLLVVITFDQGTLIGRNHVMTLLWGANVNPGEESRFGYNHYSLLRTIEEEWQLGSLNQEDQNARPITDVWQ